MRLTRRKAKDSDVPLQVGVVPPPELPANEELEKLFLAIYERIHDRAMFYAARLLSRQEAEDALYGALGDLWERWRFLRPEQRTDAYCFGVVHHYVCDALSVSAPLDSLEDAESQLPHHVVGAEEPFTRGDTAADVIDLAVAAMSPQRRQVFLLIREQGVRYKEVARTLRVSEGTVNTHIADAMAEVRAKFTQMGFRVAEPRTARLGAPVSSDSPSQPRETIND